MPRKRNRAAKSDLELLDEKINTTLPNQTLQVYAGEPTGKMSEMLKELRRPYLPPNMDSAMYQHLVLLGVVAWNIACQPRATEAAELEKVLQLLNNRPAAQPDMRWMLTALVARKRRLFDDNKRRIIQYQVSETKDQFRLSVASTPE